MNTAFKIMLSYIFLCTLLSTYSYGQASSDKFGVQYNKNIETYFLAELLAVKYRQTNQQWEAYKLKECSTYQPIAKRALEHFSDPAYEPLGRKTAEFLDILIWKYNSGNDIMMAPLLDQPTFDLKKRPRRYGFDNMNFDKAKTDSLEQLVFDYLQFLYNSYHTLHIDEFFIKNASFYNGAINEVSRLIPKNFTTAMEKYYGESRYKYLALVSPMMIWPIEDNEGRGISATIVRGNKKTVYEIMSPYVKVPVDSSDTYKQFGYDYEPTAKFLTIHEFGHSFVNEPLGRYRERIERSASLFTPRLKELMASKGVSNWNTYVIETFVRLGEIRIAALQGDKLREERLRSYHTNNEHFVFLPSLEKRIVVFEQERKRYPKWSDYIPELLAVFEGSSHTFVDSHLP